MPKLVFAFAGQIASGKGTATKYLVEKYGANSYRFSTMLRDILDRLYLDQSRENMQKLSTILRSNFGEDLFSKVIASDVKKDKKNIIAVDGARRPSDFAYLKKEASCKIIYIEADIEKRYERIIKRVENPDDRKKTFEQFKKDHKGEAELKIKDLKKEADYIIDNDSDQHHLYEQINGIIKKVNRNNASI
ncbi:MAG: AAA family ATPase [Candidatus Portnoybacteria bacterium]|nr:AAA family ATPase [Candidatus Portnoybacteria bacterium]